MNKKNTKIMSKSILKDILEMSFKAKSSHIGSSLSIVDILSVLYGKILKYDPKNPTLETRDRLILSKGHACSALYATLANYGYFNRKELSDYGQDYSMLMAHASHKVPGVEFSTGSLGHGLSFGAGLALAAKRKKEKWRVFVINSDGEMAEGSNWEAILFSAHHKLNNLCLIIDYNKLQSFTSVKNTLNIEPLKEKFNSFGWHTTVVDAHNHNKLNTVLTNISKVKDKPICIIANSIKGKGISFMEDKVLWHYKSLDKKQYKQALSEL